MHYLRAGDQLTAEKISKLDGYDVFHVLDDHRQSYKNFIHDRMNEDGLDPMVKATILRESSLTLAEEIFEQENVAIALAESKEVITQFIDFMEQEPEGMANLNFAFFT